MPFDVSLWDVYRFAYSVALRSAGRNHLKEVARLAIEPCNYWRNAEVPAVLGRLRLEPGMKVLDIGSPKLPSLFVWSQLGAEVWATDLFPYFFDEYSHYWRRLGTPSTSSTYHIEVQDARKLSYPDSCFDRVYSISVLEHIEGEGDSAAMREIARVLKPGGLCCLTVPAAAQYREETTSAELYFIKPVDDRPVFYQRHYDEESLRKRLLDASGLCVLSVEYFAEKWFPFESFYERLPRAMKILLSIPGPALSKLFLHRVDGRDACQAKTTLVTLRKR